MDAAYWNLFWSTGMPEAWLMSRDGTDAVPLGMVQGGGQVITGPLSGSSLPPVGYPPGNAKNLY